MTLLDLLIISLAVWRVTMALTQEKIGEPLRTRLSIQPGQTPERWLPYLFSCLWCLSVWVSFVGVLLWDYLPHEVYYALAVSSAAIIVNEKLT
jgi:hypothetical protein